jgi:16S rRNA (guanine527-N7)-methyltransferase
VKDRREVVAEGARAFAVTLDAAAADTMLSYLDRLLAANETINLTAVRDPAAAVERHLLDSLAFGLHVREHGPPGTLVDLGTGGGFPGVPIAIAWPRAEVHLLDSTRKKIEAVRRIVEDMSLTNVRLHWGRGGSAEGLGDAAPPPVEAVLARAVGPLEEILSAAHPLLAPGGVLVAWKGDVPASEKDAASRAAARLRMESLPDLVYQLGAPRRLVRWRRARRR